MSRGLIGDEAWDGLARIVDGPHYDPGTGLVSGSIELPGGLPPEPEDDDPGPSA